MAREINLVPDVKSEMIKALKLRNITFFICIIVASVSLAAILISAGIAAGQQAVADGKKETLTLLSSKINSYSDLNDFLTIEDQLNNLSAISNNKKLLSRTFALLPALIPTGANTITISELNVNLSTGGDPTISFDAQANAGEPPYIDYAVLESFKKSMTYMRYDYGTYVDKEGNDIPAYCIVETGADGSVLSDQEKGYYALWLITGDGCNPAYETEVSEEGSDENRVLTAARVAEITRGYETEQYEGQTVVRIWRTPQFNDWYKESKVEGQPYMSVDGEISGVAHFESECISYIGAKDAAKNSITWASANDGCRLVPGSENIESTIEANNGITISNSSNGRIGDSNELVLRFSATITINSEYYNFNNKHMLAIGPKGRYNVTDSYAQIQNMFEERALDCESNDIACNNTNGGN